MSFSFCAAGCQTHGGKRVPRLVPEGKLLKGRGDLVSDFPESSRALGQTGITFSKAEWNAGWKKMGLIGWTGRACWEGDFLGTWLIIKPWEGVFSENPGGTAGMGKPREGGLGLVSKLIGRMKETIRGV